MKITIPRPDGDIVIEVDNNDEIPAVARIVSALRLDPPAEDASDLERADYEKVAAYVRGASVFADDIRVVERNVPQEFGPTKAYAEEQMRVDDLKLSPVLQDVYEYLRSNGDDGASPTELARAFGVNRPAMDQRLRQLKKRGAAEQVSRGLWRVA